MAKRPAPVRGRFRPELESLENRIVPAAVRPDTGFTTNNLPANDDGSTGLVNIGFTANLFGLQRSAVYVNNNGNVTFDRANPTFTPSQLTAAGAPQMIAAFFADVDTRAGNIVTYGQSTINGRPAFGVDFVNVGYFSQHVDKLDSFQIVLIQRCDLNPGDFDIEFNYDKIQWETGDASGGTNGIGGVPARVGFTNGSGVAGTNFELPGSGVSGAFLDGGPQSLAGHSLNSTVVGRYLFPVRNGQINSASQVTRYYAVGADAGSKPEVKVFDANANTVLYDFMAFNPAFTGGVRVAVGDVNKDGTPDIICAAGTGGGPQVRVFDGKNPANVLADFYAFPASFSGGVNVATGDVNGDGFSDIIAAEGPGGSPLVRVFDGQTFRQTLSFNAYIPQFTGGVNVAAGDLTMTGKAQIVTGAGPGGGPHVRVFDGQTGAQLTTPIGSYYAYDAAFAGGVTVAVGRLNGSCDMNIVTGAGPTGAPQVRVWDPVSGNLINAFDLVNTSNLFFGDSVADFSGIRVAVGDLSGNGTGTILATFQRGHASNLYAYDYASGTISDQGAVLPVGGLNGVFVGSSK